MCRRQLWSVSRLKSVATSVLGIGLGLIFVISLQMSLSGQGIQVLSKPVVQPQAFVVLGALVGVFAAVFPARRGARIAVLRAVTTR